MADSMRVQRHVPLQPWGRCLLDSYLADSIRQLEEQEHQEIQLQQEQQEQQQEQEQQEQEPEHGAVSMGVPTPDPAGPSCVDRSCEQPQTGSAAAAALAAALAAVAAEVAGPQPPSPSASILALPSSKLSEPAACVPGASTSAEGKPARLAPAHWEQEQAAIEAQKAEARQVRAWFGRRGCLGCTAPHTWLDT
jgi:hypothetical protein